MEAPSLTVASCTALPRLDDLVEDGRQVLARGVALAVRLDGRVREEDRQRHHALGVTARVKSESSSSYCV